MSFNKLLNKLCTIQTKTRSQNGTGSVTESWANTYVNVPCRYNRSKVGSVVASSYQVTLEDFTFYFESTVTITEGSRIVVDGKTFEVSHVYRDSAAHHIEAMARYRTYE